MTTQTAEELKKKIGAWLSDPENNENETLDFLLDDCGIDKYYEYKTKDEDPYLCVDCGKDFKWKSGTSSTGAGVNSYHCGSCGVKEWDSFNKKQAEEKCEKCEKCDIRLGTYDGTWVMKVDWFGKTMCGECALGKAERKERK